MPEHGRPGGLRYLALADDATGALETGARFREAGIEALVRFDGGLAGVVDTETRHLACEDAFARVRAVALAAKQAGVTHIFKKTDSTLRGPIGAEFRALLEVWPELPLVYAPAYPALGRTVRGGELLVDGRPLAETAFARDPLNPVRESSIAALLGDGLPAGRVIVRDGETDSDLDAVAQWAAGRPCIVAGTAAMASAWATSLTGIRGQGWRPELRLRKGLVVNGSLHPASRAQVESGGVAVVAHRTDADPMELGGRLAAAGPWAALCSCLPRAGEPLVVAEHAARCVAHAIRVAAPDCLVLFGGDTVLAILRELGVVEAEPHGEILPGAAASSIVIPGSGRATLMITKAGGFGGPDYLARIREILEMA